MLVILLISSKYIIDRSIDYFSLPPNTKNKQLKNKLLRRSLKAIIDKCKIAK